MVFKREKGRDRLLFLVRPGLISSLDLLEKMLINVGVHPTVVFLSRVACSSVARRASMVCIGFVSLFLSFEASQDTKLNLSLCLIGMYGALLLHPTRTSPLHSLFGHRHLLGTFVLGVRLPQRLARTFAYATSSASHPRARLWRGKLVTLAESDGEREAAALVEAGLPCRVWSCVRPFLSSLSSSVTRVTDFIILSSIGVSSRTRLVRYDEVLPFARPILPFLNLGTATQTNQAVMLC
jgi:hypothetical protein